MESTSTPVLRVDTIVKRYGNFTALDGVSLTAERGSIYALLGPNGAGKSTLVKSITGLLSLNGGEIRIQGLPHTERAARERLAYLPETFRFYPYYTVLSAMEFFADLAGTPSPRRRDRIFDALDLAGIKNLAPKRVGELSKGQTRRLGIASLFLSPADLLLLDEPFDGLDPIGFKELKELMRQLKNDGKTILINSHILAEIEHLADHIALLHEGKLIAEGPLDTLLKDGNLEDFFYRAVGGQSGDSR